MSWKRRFFWAALLLGALSFGTFRLYDSACLERFPRVREFVLKCRLFLGDEAAALNEAYRISSAMYLALKDKGYRAAEEHYERLAELNRKFPRSVALTGEQMTSALDLLIAKGRSGDIGGAVETYRKLVEIAAPLSGQYRIERRKLQGAYLMLYYLKEPDRLDDALSYVESADALRHGFEADIHTVRIGVSGLRVAVLGFLKQARFEEGERIYRHLQDLRTSYPDDPDSAEQHLIAAVWGAWYCVKEDDFLRTDAPLAQALLDDAADLAKAFPAMEHYLERRAKTLAKLVPVYLHEAEDWDKAQAACDALLSLSLVSDGTKKDEERLWGTLARWQLSALKHLMFAQTGTSDISGALKSFEKFYALSERFVQPEQSQNIRHTVRRERKDAVVLMLSAYVGVRDFDAAKALYDRVFKARPSVSFLEEPRTMKAGMEAARQIQKGYLAIGDRKGAQEWYDELRRLQDRSGTTRDWRGDPKLHKIELLGIEAEAAGELLAAYGQAGRMKAAAELYRRIESLIGESGFFGLYSMPVWIDAAMRMTFFCACKGDKAAAKRYGEACTKAGRTWKEVLDGTSEGLLPSWESEERRQCQIARSLIEKYDARSPKELQELCNGLEALRALSPHLKGDAQLERFQSEVADKLRQAEDKK